jgi:hypothetical protein
MIEQEAEISADDLLDVLDLLQDKLKKNRPADAKKWSRIIVEAVSAETLTRILEPLIDSPHLSKHLQENVDALAYCAEKNIDGKEVSIASYLAGEDLAEPESIAK